MSALSEEAFLRFVEPPYGSAIYNDWRALVGAAGGRKATVEDVLPVVAALALRESPMSLARNVPPVPPIGLDDALNELYAHLCYRFSVPPTLSVPAKQEPSSVLLSLAAAPGSGKSYLLDVLLRLRGEDVDRARDALNTDYVFQGKFGSREEARDDALDHVKKALPLALSYNGDTPYRAAEYDTDLEHGLALRLLHAAFDVSFHDLEARWPGLALRVRVAFAAIRHALGDAQRGIVVAIDEVSSVDDEAGGQNALVQHAVQLLGEHRVGVVVAALAATPVQMTATRSQREVKFVQVPRPTQEQLVDGLWSYAPFSELDGVAKTNVQALLAQLHGHWRTIATLRLIVHEERALANDFGALHRRLARHESVRSTMVYLSTAWPVVRDAVLGKLRGSDAYGELGSLEELSVRGVLRNAVTSLADESSAVPEMSPFALSQFAEHHGHSGDSAQRFTCDRLRAMLSQPPTASGFELFHVNFVALRMRLTPEDERVCDLRRWLGAGGDSAVVASNEMWVWPEPNDDDCFTVRIPDAGGVRSAGGESLADVLGSFAGQPADVVAGNVVHFGGSEPAVDSLSFAQVEPTGELVTLLWQQKRRATDDSEPLRQTKEVKKGVRQLSTALAGAPSLIRDGRVFYIMAAWHDVYRTADEKALLATASGVSRGIVLTEAALRRWYGPSLTQMAVFNLRLSLV